MTTPTVKLGGVTIGGGFIYGWKFASGTNPVDQLYTVTSHRAEGIKAFLGQPQTLTTSSPGRPESAWDFIYPIEIKPGEDPFVKRVRLIDRRWLWPKRWVAITMNKRRATGDTFLVGGGKLENKILLDELRYAEYSLFPPGNPSDRWTAIDALTYVLEVELDTPAVFKDEPPTQVEIQDLIIDDHGADAVAILLAYLPGMNLYINRAGEAVIYDTQSGGESEILVDAPPPQTGGGTVEVVDKRAIRPSKVIVLFTPEVEHRFNYEEPGATRERKRDTPDLYPVMRSPDVTTTLADKTVVTRGAIAKQEDLFAAWGAFGRAWPGIGQQPVTFDRLRKHACRNGFQSFLQAWGNDPHQPPNPVNTRRAEATVNSWRREFQLDEFYVQRLQSIRPYRASLLSVDRGVYAPSEVFADWTRRPGFYGHATGNDANDGHGWAMRGYPSNDLLDSAQAAPARVSVVDEGAGLIRIDPTLDSFGFATEMWFGFPEGADEDNQNKTRVRGGLPVQDAGAAKRQSNALFRHWGLVVFERSWKMAVVLTVVPGSPNTLDRFLQVEVDPTEISPDVGQSDGPVVYVRVFPGVMTARYGWKDERSQQIEAAIKGTFPYSGLDDLLLNEEWVNDVAKAAAARVYEPLRDRPIGSMSVDWRPDMEPAGSLGSVEHVMSGGRLETRATFAAVTQPADVWRYLNASTRKAILMVLANQGSPG